MTPRRITSSASKRNPQFLAPIRVKPELAGIAAGLGVFVPMLLSALLAQLYDAFADGAPRGR